MKKFGFFICCISLLIIFSFFSVSNAQKKESAETEEKKLAAANEIKGEVEADPATEKEAELQDAGLKDIAKAPAPGGEASAPSGKEAEKKVKK